MKKSVLHLSQNGCILFYSRFHRTPIHYYEWTIEMGRSPSLRNVMKRSNTRVSSRFDHSLNSLDRENQLPPHRERLLSLFARLLDGSYLVLNTISLYPQSFCTVVPNLYNYQLIQVFDEWNGCMSLQWELIATHYYLDIVLRMMSMSFPQWTLLFTVVSRCFSPVLNLSFPCNCPCLSEWGGLR